MSGLLLVTRLSYYYYYYYYYCYYYYYYQRSIVVTLLDLKNAFGEVHHNIIPVVLKHHHVPEEIVNIVKSLYVRFHTTVTTSRFSTEFLPVSKGVLQGDCLSPLLFSLLFNTLIQYIKSDKLISVNGLLVFEIVRTTPLVSVCRRRGGTNWLRIRKSNTTKRFYDLVYMV